MKRKGWLLLLAVSVATWLLNGQLAVSGKPENNLRQFGWEYGHIAAALAEGRGFADAMGAGTGPTAWMPPVLPVIYAGFFLLFGVKTPAAMWALCTLKAVAMGIAAAGFSWLTGRRWGLGGALAGVGFSALYLWLEGYHLCNELDDSWWLACLSLAVLASLFQLSSGCRLNPAQVILHLLLPLSSPTLTLGYLVCLALLGWRDRLIPGALKRFAVGIGLCLLPCLFWGARNYFSMGKLYPVKSNLWFDFLEANLWDDDGLLTDSFFINFHPVNQNLVRDQYVALGEVAFMEQSRQEAEAVDPQVWLRRCGTRLVNSSLYMRSSWDFYLLKDPIDAPDLKTLHQSGWMQSWKGGNTFWLFLQRPSAEVKAQLEALPLVNREAVLRSRADAEAKLGYGLYSWRGRCWSLFFTLLPSGAVLLLLVWPGRQRSQEELLAVTLYGCYLLPYILIQHYSRYQVSVPWLQGFLVLAAAGRCLRWRQLP